MFTFLFCRAFHSTASFTSVARAQCLPPSFSLPHPLSNPSADTSSPRANPRAFSMICYFVSRCILHPSIRAFVLAIDSEWTLTRTLSKRLSNIYRLIRYLSANSANTPFVWIISELIFPPIMRSFPAFVLTSKFHPWWLHCGSSTKFWTQICSR